MVMVSLVSVDLAASQPGADDGQEGRLGGDRVLEVVWQVGVEGDAITLTQLVALAIAHEDHRTLLDERRLTTTGLV